MFQSCLRHHFGGEVGFDLYKVDHQLGTGFFFAGAVGQIQSYFAGFGNKYHAVQVGAAESGFVAVAVFLSLVNKDLAVADAGLVGI